MGESLAWPYSAWLVLLLGTAWMISILNVVESLAWRHLISDSLACWLYYASWEVKGITSHPWLVDLPWIWKTVPDQMTPLGRRFPRSELQINFWLIWQLVPTLGSLPSKPSLHYERITIDANLGQKYVHRIRLIMLSQCYVWIEPRELCMSV